MLKLKSLLLPIGITVLYLLIAIVFGLFINDGLIVTLIADIVITVLCIMLVRKSKKMKDTESVKPSVMFYALLVGSLLLVWFICQITSSVLYELAGDANFDKYNDTVASNIALYAFIAIFIAPTMEEVLMRGIWFRHLKNNLHPIVAYILSSSVFAVLHGTLVHIPTGILFGLFLCVIYDYTDSLILSVILHFGFNLFAILLGGMIVPDYMLTVEFVTISYLLTFSAIIIAIVMLYKLRNRSNLDVQNQ